MANQADMSHGIRPTRRIKMASGDSILHYFSTKISFTRRFLFQSITNARRDNTNHIEELFTYGTCIFAFQYFANNFNVR